MGQSQIRNFENSEKNNDEWISLFEEGKAKKEIILCLPDDILLKPLTAYIHSMEAMDPTQWKDFQEELAGSQAPLRGVFLFDTDNKSLNLDWGQINSALKCYLVFRYIDNMENYRKYFDSESFSLRLKAVFCMHKQ